MNLLSLLFNFSHSGSQLPVDTKLIGPRLVLRTGDPADWKAWRALRGDSRDFLVPWEPSWPDNALSYSYFCQLLRHQWRDWRNGKAYAFMIFKQGEGRAEDVLVGGIALNDIQRGISQKGTLGYWIGKSYAQQGFMTEAAGLVCDFAFQSLRLHRVEASCLPHNTPSKKLLQRLGFEEEGFAKAYLQINGRWEDHLLWGKTRKL